MDEEGTVRLTKVLYCESRRSDQKGKCEKNHEHFREMILKVETWTDLDKKTINYVSNQVNNYPRKILNFHTPLECSLKILNKKVLELYFLKILTPTQVILKHIEK